MRKVGEPKPHNRDGIWYLVRRVPKEFADLDRRGIVRISTDIAVAAEARDILLLVADTGLRLSEAANLLPETIFLDAATPHVEVKPIGRQLKTGHSIRKVPLVGSALAAMKRHPKGFPRYQDKADSLSALVNKYLDGKGLLPTPEHSFYSLRHTFEDRLTAVEAPEKVIASLMGHKWIRPKYGAGPTLEQKARWMAKIAFEPPHVPSPQPEST